MDTRDVIERAVAIDAPLDRVWGLVSEPGWWIGDGDRSQQQRYREGDLDIIEDPKYGRFPIRTEIVEPRHHISYRWVMDRSDERPRELNSTLVEFWLSERGSGTLLRVVESGFESLDVSDEDRRKAIDGNIEGWTQQLDIVRTLAERITA